VSNEAAPSSTKPLDPGQWAPRIAARVFHDIAIVYDPTSDAEVELARFLLRYCPHEVSIRATPIGADEPLTAAHLATECIVLLTDTRASAMRKVATDANRELHLVVAFLQPWPADLARFHACYAIADLVLVANARLWRGLGPLPHTRALPTIDDETFQVKGTDNERGRRVAWFLASAAESQPTYEPWVPSPRALLSGTEFEEHVVMVDGASPEARAGVLNRAAIAVCAESSPASDRNIAEAAACGCSIVVTRRANRAGIIREGVTGTVTDRDLQSLLRALRSALSERSTLTANLQAAIGNTGWRACGHEVWRSIAEPPPPAPKAIDLSPEVTVFVSTVGAPSLPACLAHLQQQDCHFVSRMIENVAPMSAAFQKMLDECRTPYYVQVDEDMLLYPNAVRQLHASIEDAPADVALAVAYLHDVHLDAPVQGVKIFRHGIVRRYPFADTQSCEIDQIERMRADGLTYRLAGCDQSHGEAGFPYPILGLHGGSYTPRTVYERFRTLELARRQRPRNFNHQEAWPAMLVERILDRQDPLDFYALMGLFSGALSPAQLGTREKDFRTYSSLPGIEEAIAFWGRVTGGESN